MMMMMFLVVVVVRFLKWLNNMLTVDDEDHTLTFYVFRVLLFFS